MKNKLLSLYKLILIILVLVQLAAVFSVADTRSFAYDGIKYAVSVYEGGAFTLKALVMSITGLICRLVHIHPLIFVNYASIALIPLAYASYYCLFKALFKQESYIEYRYLSLIMLCIINMYGYYSGPLSRTALLTGYFTGYGIMFHILLPLFAAKLINKLEPIRDKAVKKAADKPDSTGIELESEDYLEEWDMKKHPIINARNLAIALAVVVVILLASVFVLNSKINSLYDATVNLQNQLNEYTNGDN